MARSVASSLRRMLRGARHALVYESRAGRAAEIAGWSNALASALVGASAFYVTRGAVVSAALFTLALLLLRLALAHRSTVWVAAALGTLAVAGFAGSLGWIFAHALDAPYAPPIAAVLCGLGAATLPATAYARFARLRADDVPDSIVEAPSTRPGGRNATA